MVTESLPLLLPQLNQKFTAVKITVHGDAPVPVPASSMHYLAPPATKPRSISDASQSSFTLSCATDDIGSNTDVESVDLRWSDNLVDRVMSVFSKRRQPRRRQEKTAATASQRRRRQATRGPQKNLDRVHPHMYRPYEKSTENESLIIWRRRLNVASELLATERSYVASLDQIHDLFYQPLMRALKSSAPIVKEKSKLATIFSNLQDIRSINHELLRQMEERLCGPSHSHSPLDGHKRLSVPVNSDVWDPAFSKLGDIFATLSPFLKMYAVYMINFNNALAALDRERQRNSQFKKFLAEQYKLPALASLNLDALLLTVVQRIPRYRLLLGDLLKMTPDTHGDYHDLKNAMAAMEDIATFMNEEIRKHENFQQVLALQSRLQGFADPSGDTSLVAPGRRLIRQGRLMKICRRGNEPRQFFLFSDMLVYAVAETRGLSTPGSTYIFRRCMPLQNVHVVNVADEDCDQDRQHSLTVSNQILADARGFSLLPQAAVTDNSYSFLILTTDKSFQVYCESEEEKTAWIGDLRAAIEHVQAVHRRRTRGGTDEGDGSDFRAPVWMPDHSAAHCMLCRVEFTMWRRRHHCRKCGQLCCAACSSKTFIVPSFPLDRVERCCDVCYFDMYQAEVAAAQDDETRQEKTRGDLARLFNGAAETSLISASDTTAQAEFATSRISIAFNSLSRMDKELPRLPDEKQHKSKIQRMIDRRLRWREKASDLKVDTAKVQAQSPAAKMLRTIHSAPAVDEPPKLSSSPMAYAQTQLQSVLQKLKSAYDIPQSLNTDAIKTKLKRLRSISLTTELPQLPLFRRKSMALSADSAVCQLCCTPFGMWRWRYACVRCTKVVCNACSRHVPADEDRVCDICFFGIQLPASNVCCIKPERGRSSSAVAVPVGKAIRYRHEMKRRESFDFTTIRPRRAAPPRPPSLHLPITHTQ